MTSAFPDSGSDPGSIVVVTSSFGINAHVIVVGSCDQEPGCDAIDEGGRYNESDE